LADWNCIYNKPLQPGACCTGHGEGSLLEIIRIEESKGAIKAIEY
jgi:hypothetical protein